MHLARCCAAPVETARVLFAFFFYDFSLLKPRIGQSLLEELEELHSSSWYCLNLFRADMQGGSENAGTPSMPGLLKF